jgi:hypothetical protein
VTAADALAVEARCDLAEGRAAAARAARSPLARALWAEAAAPLRWPRRGGRRRSLAGSAESAREPAALQTWLRARR